MDWREPPAGGLRPLDPMEIDYDIYPENKLSKITEIPTGNDLLCLESLTDSLSVQAPDCDLDAKTEPWDDPDESNLDGFDLEELENLYET